MWIMWIMGGEKWVMHIADKLWKRVMHINISVKSVLSMKIMEKSQSYQQVINKLWITFPWCMK